MAKKKKTDTKVYRVVKPFKSTINNSEFNCKKGDTVELTSFEHSILSRFLEDI